MSRVLIYFYYIVHPIKCVVSGSTRCISICRRMADGLKIRIQKGACATAIYHIRPTIKARTVRKT